MLQAINKNCNENRATIRKYWVGQRAKALKDADFVVNAIQVRRYDPCTITTLRFRRNTACGRPLPTRWHRRILPRAAHHPGDV